MREQENPLTSGSRRKHVVASLACTTADPYFREQVQAQYDVIMQAKSKLSIKVRL